MLPTPSGGASPFRGVGRAASEGGGAAAGGRRPWMTAGLSWARRSISSGPQQSRALSAISMAACAALFGLSIWQPPDWAQVVHTGFAMEGVGLDDIAEQRLAAGMPAAADKRRA